MANRANRDKWQCASKRGEGDAKSGGRIREKNKGMRGSC